MESVFAAMPGAGDMATVEEEEAREDWGRHGRHADSGASF